MPNSMTGYGRGEAEYASRRFVVEIKSVNHRFNDVSVRLPKLLNPFERMIKNELSRKIQRGKTDVYVTLESYSEDDVKVSVNTALADACFKSLNLLKERFNIDEPVSLSVLTRLADLIVVEKSAPGEEASAEIWEGIGEALAKALDAVVQMREKEGEALKNDLTEKIGHVLEMTEKIKEMSPLILKEYTEKLKRRICELLNNTAIDEQRLLTEVAVFADKVSVDEEITRLLSHTARFGEILDESGAIGKKLDFIVQEMNREINTIGSKSNDLNVNRMVVEIKNELEKIREQVQNIE